MLFCFRLLDIEYEMTNFAYYYVGIGAGVFILGYLQVRLLNKLLLVLSCFVNVKYKICKKKNPLIKCII